MAAAYFFSFDTHYLFAQSEYYFIYKDTSFKLIAGDEKYQHLLVTTVNDDKYPIQASNNALEFLACLAWDSNLRVEYSGSCGIGGNHSLENLGRQLQVMRYSPVSEIKHQFPKKIVNITNEKSRKVISLYKEMLLTKRSLPNYTFLTNWRLVELIEKTHNPSEIIYSLIGWNFFRKKFRTKKDIYFYLNEQVRNATAHGREKKRIVNIIDIETYKELNELNNQTSSNLRKYASRYLEKEPPLFLFQTKDSKYPIFMTEKDYYTK